MGDVIGQTYALTVFTPITPGREAALREHLESLPQGPNSPLAKLPTTHFARWQILHGLFHQGPPQKPDDLRSQYLVFTCDFDGDLSDYLEDMRTDMGSDADEIWAHCVGYPGSRNAEEFRRYFEHNRIETTMPFAAYPEHTVVEVREALALRQRLIAFAQQAQDLAPEALYEAYREAFERGAREPQLR
jgi:hypothetical protein